MKPKAKATKKGNGLKIAALNIVSLRKHRHELNVLLHENDIDIIALSETRLSGKIKDPEVSIDGYKIFRHDRDEKGGGVAIYLKVQIPDPLQIITSDVLELLCLEIKPNIGKSFYLISWYRPPTGEIDTVSFENLREFLKKLDKDEKEIILVGDTNCDFKGSPLNSNAKKLQSVYAEYQIEQLIKAYTRVAIREGANGQSQISHSLIDHFSTNKSKYILETGVLETAMVDHYMVYAIRKVNAWRLNTKSKNNTVESRNMKNYDKAAFQQDLDAIDWENILKPLSQDPNKMVSVFQELFDSVLSLHAPIRKRKRKTEYAPWLNAGLRSLMVRRDKAKKDARRNPELWPLYKKLRNEVTKAIRSTMEDHYSGLIEQNKNDPKEMWRTINKVLDRDSSKVLVTSLNCDGKLLTNGREIATALNKHFVSVGPKLAEEIKTKTNDDLLAHICDNNSTILNFKMVDVPFIFRALKGLKNGKASGPDRIPVGLVKDASEIIALPLTLIYNSSLTAGVFPDVWKAARVTPIFKSGVRSDVNNYRPISVLSIFARVLEKIVHDQLIDYFKEKQLLKHNQHAFRKLHSTVTSLIKSTDEWLSNIDSQKVNMTMFLDLKKAFDTVDHKILLEKLFKYGIQGKIISWFCSYLTERRQYCRIDGECSKPLRITCGIPQGSCLGPLLFIIYLNDFEECLEFSSASMYADDTHTTIASKDITELSQMMKEELENISEWMRVNKLSANPKKN